MTRDELTALGWHTWYSDNYWVHPDIVDDPTKQDYTNYGMSFDEAVKFERLGRPKFKFFGLPGFSFMEMRDRMQSMPTTTAIISDPIDLPTELILLTGALARLKILPETEAIKGAKQCLAAAIGWIQREIKSNG